MTRYFYHAESGCAWPQQDDAPAPDDGLSMEIDAAQYERICKDEFERRMDAGEWDYDDNGNVVPRDSVTQDEPQHYCNNCEPGPNGRRCR